MEPDAYEKAKKRVEEKMGFFSHLGAYVVVNLILLVLNLVQSPGDLWFYWPLLGWGIGVFFHGMGVFVWGEGSGLKDRMIQEEMRRHRQHEDRS
jgi:protein-S-isoprenylcysteine O-methyltransferase Ste14